MLRTRGIPQMTQLSHIHLLKDNLLRHDVDQLPPSFRHIAVPVVEYPLLQPPPPQCLLPRHPDHVLLDLPGNTVHHVGGAGAVAEPVQAKAQTMSLGVPIISLRSGSQTLMLRTWGIPLLDAMTQLSHIHSLKDNLLRHDVGQLPPSLFRHVVVPVVEYPLLQPPPPQCLLPCHPDHVLLDLPGDAVHHVGGAGAVAEPVQAEAAVRLEALRGEDVGEAVRLAAAGIGKEEDGGLNIVALSAPWFIYMR